jgi:hypothetical protein
MNWKRLSLSAVVTGTIMLLSQIVLHVVVLAEQGAAIWAVSHLFAAIYIQEGVAILPTRLVWLPAVWTLFEVPLATLAEEPRQALVRSGDDEYLLDEFSWRCLHVMGISVGQSSESLP